MEASSTVALPFHRDHFYGGQWKRPLSGEYFETYNPATGQPLAKVANSTSRDVDAAVTAALAGFREWKRVAPLERAKILRVCANRIREHGEELAMLDAADCGNPVREMRSDASHAAAMFDFFAGLVTELKGNTISMGASRLNYSVREPHGVVARIVAFNHPLMFAAMKAAAPLAAGNAVIVKAPEQAPLSSIRLAELVGDLFPQGAFNVLHGRGAGPALSAHTDVAMVGLIGSVETGKAVMRAAAGNLKIPLLELGGKNALIAFPDSDPERVAAAVIQGMNFSWCGQSCGSTSRAFIHSAIHEEVVEAVLRRISHFKPGIPTDPETTMGAIISREHQQRILEHVSAAQEAGARLLCGGSPPSDVALQQGFFIEPTVFADVTSTMRIAREEIFGPVLAIIRWDDEDRMLDDVNGVPYGLTCSIWTNDVSVAHRTASEVEAGYVWVNEVGSHFLGAAFGGVKQSGFGREECIGELYACTREKNVHLNFCRLPPHGENA